MDYNLNTSSGRLPTKSGHPSPYRHQPYQPYQAATTYRPLAKQHYRHRTAFQPQDAPTYSSYPNPPTHTTHAGYASTQPPT
jgi:hypothetical protein